MYVTSNAIFGLYFILGIIWYMIWDSLVMAVLDHYRLDIPKLQTAVKEYFNNL